VLELVAGVRSDGDIGMQGDAFQARTPARGLRSQARELPSHGLRAPRTAEPSTGISEYAATSSTAPSPPRSHRPTRHTPFTTPRAP
jgi:hypothetical protein